MATQKQIEAARKNIKKAQEAWQSMSHRAHARAQPQGRRRAKPGTTGEGEFYRVVVRPKEEFVTFRNQDIGDPGHVQRLAGKRESGTWDTQAWLISKKDAHVENRKLVADTREAKDLLEKLGAKPRYVKKDIFELKDRTPDIPNKEKATRLQTKTKKDNSKEGQKAKWPRRG